MRSVAATGRALGNNSSMVYRTGCQIGFPVVSILYHIIAIKSTIISFCQALAPCKVVKNEQKRKVLTCGVLQKIVPLDADIITEEEERHIPTGDAGCYCGGVPLANIRGGQVCRHDCMFPLFQSAVDNVI